MKPIDKKLPVYRQAHVLADNYKEIGIRCVYNTRNRKVYLSLLGAPFLAVDVAGAQVTLVGVFRPFSHVRDNFLQCAREYMQMYRAMYADNPKMLKYLESGERLLACKLNESGNMTANDK